MWLVQCNTCRWTFRSAVIPHDTLPQGATPVSSTGLRGRLHARGGGGHPPGRWARQRRAGRRCGGRWLWDHCRARRCQPGPHGDVGGGGGWPATVQHARRDPCVRARPAARHGRGRRRAAAARGIRRRACGGGGACGAGSGGPRGRPPAEGGQRARGAVVDPRAGRGGARFAASHVVRAAVAGPRPDGRGRRVATADAGAGRGVRR